MSSYETYLTEEKKKEDELAAADIAQKKKDAEARKTQINDVLDKSAAAQTGVYEQTIDEAPLQSRALYDQNAMADAVNRKKIQETLANMGMTDSGLTSSMETALTVQKQRGDNAVRADEQQRIRAAESAIDQILADTEAQKASAAIEIDQDVADYTINRKAQAETNATTTATNLYKADVEAYTAQQKQLQENQDSRAKMVQSHINNGKSIDEAKALAYAVYPDASTTEGVKYTYYNQLMQQGFGRAYAAAASDAYVNAIATGGTQEQAGAEVLYAITQTAAKEVSDRGVDIYQAPRDTAVTRGWGVIKNAFGSEATNTELTIEDMGLLVEKYSRKSVLDGKPLLSTAAQAYAVGKAYYEMVASSPADDTTTPQAIGEALEKYFSGIYLTMALDAAGLE